MNRLRTLVSSGRRRFNDDDFDLDLTYITPRVIAMALPSFGVESAFRNPASEVQRFLRAKHPDQFLIVSPHVLARSLAYIARTCVCSGAAQL
jgi:hypothetical protein